MPSEDSVLFEQEGMSVVVYLCWLEWYDMCPFTIESHLSPFDIKSIHILTCMEMDLKVLFKLNITILGVTLLFPETYLLL